MANLVKTFLLGELVKGLGVTLKNFFARKDTIYFPEEKPTQYSALRRSDNGVARASRGNARIAAFSLRGNKLCLCGQKSF